VSEQEAARRQPNDLDEQDVDEQVDDRDGTAAGDMPVWLRTLGIVVVFLFIGPPIGGYALVTLIFIAGAIDHGVDWTRFSASFLGAVSFTAIFSYVIGGVVAFFTGIMVAVSRVVGGRTTILTPLFSAVVGNGAAILLNSMVASESPNLSLPGKMPLTVGLLPSSMFAAVLCWRLAKRWKLA
jgi:hypothetical protein